MHRRIWMIALLAAAMGVLSACSLLPEEESVRTAPVIREYRKEAYETVLVERGDLVRTERVPVRYVPVQKESLSFQLTGEPVDRMLVQAGDFVEKDQLLGQQRVDDIEDAIAVSKDAVHRLELQLEHADALHQIDLQRLEILHADAGQRAIAEEIEKSEKQFAAERREIEDALAVERLRLDSLRQDLSVRQLRAPFAGTVTFVRDYEEGHRSAYAETAVTLADSTVTLFRAQTKLWNEFFPGDQYSIEVDGASYTLEVVTGESLGLAPQEKIEGQKAYVYFALTEPGPALEEGDSAAIDIELERREDVLHVPAEAVLSAGDRSLVYYQNADGVKDYKEVEIGVTIGQRTEIISGLSEGEAIISR